MYGSPPEKTRQQQEEENMDCCLGVLVPVVFLVLSVVIVFGLTLAGILDEFNPFIMLLLQVIMLLVFTGYYMVTRR
jgi:hypothetical protein